MGNVDVTGDAKLMAQHQQFVSDFRSHAPLFNIQDVKFPLYTKGIKIVDSTGRRVKLAGGNWSGAHMCRHCVDGLQCRPLRDIAMDIRYKFKMNCIRLTYSLQMFYDDKPVPEKYLKANPQLIGKTGMEIFDITIQTLTEVGLMVILNNHTSSSQWCCSNDDGDGLWWSYEFPQYKFFENCEQFARLYGNNPRVIGMDLRNELRKANGLETTWGDGNPLTDWHRAATICGQKVLKIAPHWLIFVSGVNYQLDLTGVQKTTIRYSVPNKLVYTGHFYGFSWPVPSWTLVSYEDFKKKLFNSQTFVRAIGYPYFLGQFGNNCQDVPWNYLIKYLKQTDIDWTYWALDGFKCEPEKDETYGVFCNQFKGARHPLLLADMISVGPPPGTIIDSRTQPRGAQGKNVQLPQQRKDMLLQRQAPRVHQQQLGERAPQRYPETAQIVGISGMDPRFVLSTRTALQPQQVLVQSSIPQQDNSQGQYLQRPQVQVQGGFQGNNYVPPPTQQYQQTMQQYQQYQPTTQQYQPYQLNNQQYTVQNTPYQAVRGQTFTGQTPNQLNQPNQTNQANQQYNGQKVVYFDSNGRPILR